MITESCPGSVSFVTASEAVVACPAAPQKAWEAGHFSGTAWASAGWQSSWHFGPVDMHSDFLTPEVSGGAEEPASSTHAVEEQSEELPGPELQKDPKACQPAPEQASFPKIHSRRFRE